MWAVWACLWAVVVAAPQSHHLERDSFRRPHAAMSWQKRLVAAEHHNSAVDDYSEYHIPNIKSGNSQLMLRSPRGERQYDVPQIGNLFSYKFFNYLISLFYLSILTCFIVFIATSLDIMN